MYQARNLEALIAQDMGEKFVFLSGPRQVGKTELAQQILRASTGKYYNWDLAEDRETILTKGFIHDRTAILDEVHKYSRWKTLIKGVYDKYHKELKLLITGSARLDLFQRSGDSLFGRYYLYHLHPFSLGELNGVEVSKPVRSCEPDDSKKGYPELFKFGGFPEPFLKNSVRTHQRWSIARRERLLEEDIRQLTEIKLVSLLEHLMILLPNKIGSPLSINALREDLEVGFNTVKNWLTSFERLFIVFQLSPFSEKIVRSIKKEKKLYLWDWSQVKDPAARFENLVASHLFKAVTYWRDQGFGDFALHYLRDRDRREVDFCITKNQKPWLLVETKMAETQLSETLILFSKRLGVPGLQLLHKSGIYKKKGSISILSADRWLGRLP